MRCFGLRAESSRRRSYCPPGRSLSAKCVKERTASTAESAERGEETRKRERGVNAKVGSATEDPPDDRGISRMRVVSLLPAATEIVGALGLVEHLVGVSHECD